MVNIVTWNDDWWGCTQFDSIGCGSEERNGVETEKGKEIVGVVKLDLRFGEDYISHCQDG